MIPIVEQNSGKKIPVGLSMKKACDIKSSYKWRLMLRLPVFMNYAKRYDLYMDEYYIGWSVLNVLLCVDRFHFNEGVGFKFSWGWVRLHEYEGPVLR